MSSPNKLIYVSGPYSFGDVGENIHIAIATGIRLMKEGLVPYVPHAMTHMMHCHEPQPHSTWVTLDLVFVAKSDALLRLPGYSRGADMETEHARKLGIPVFYHIEDIISWHTTTK